MPALQQMIPPAPILFALRWHPDSQASRSLLTFVARRCPLQPNKPAELCSTKQQEVKTERLM